MGMLGEICKELNNYFVRSRDEDIVVGDFVISGGVLTGIPVDVQNDRYIRIAGSVFNDGVYAYPPQNLTDEEFEGAVWLMRVPPDFISLVSEIEAWMQNPDIQSAMSSPYTSESFGGYSYQKNGGTTAEDGSNISWKNQFASRLNKWRKVSPL